MDDPEGFLRDMKGRLVIIDEIHRLANPSELLKIAADHFPDTSVVATGSSTLGASAKFRDTLAGRKHELWLTPIMSEDLTDFGTEDMRRRFLHGGLPQFFLSDSFPERDFQEWLDGYWARDIQELFRLERRHSFQRFLELLLAQSGGIFEASRFAAPCEVSRTTIANYLTVLEATFAVHIVRPFAGRRHAEVVSAPRVYGFDTGFACYFGGRYQLRAEDMGLMWEHVVLNELHARLQSRDVFYWRDKRGHEIDFVLAPRGNPPVAVECKWRADEFDPKNLKIFRKHYPEGKSVVAAADVDREFVRSYGDMEVSFVGLRGVAAAVLSRSGLAANTAN